jgi:hypothetical protein
LQTNHFHIDLKGNYIPGLCAGLSIRVEDLGAPLDEKKYPFITSLFNQGVGGLLDIACQKYGFVTGHEYLNKCHLCQEIRNFIVIEKGLSSIELQPVDFYLNL